MPRQFKKDFQYYKFCLYGFLKNQRFFDPFLILFFLEKGLNPQQIGALYSIRFLTRAFLEIPSGLVADSLGRRGAMIFSYIMYLLSFPAYYFSDSFVWFIIPTFLFGIGDAFRTGTHKAMIFEYLKLNNWSSEKADYYGHTRSWSQFGSAISSLLAALIVFVSNNYSNIFLFSIIPYLLGTILLASYPGYLDKNIQDKEKRNSQKFLQTFKTTLKSINNYKSIRTFSGISLLSGFYLALKDYIQPLIQTFALSLPLLLAISDKQRTAVLIALITFTLYFISSVASKNAGKINRFYGSNSKTLNHLLLLGISAGIIAGIGSHFAWPLLAIILFIGIQAIENMRKPTGVAHLSEKYKSNILATVLSIESQISSLLAAIFSFGIGTLIQFHSLGIAILLISLLGGVLGIIFRLKSRQ